MLGPAGVTGQSAKLLENNGGHFRFGNIRWEKLEGNTVQFTIESAWRRDYGSAYWKGSGDDGLTVVGDEIHLNGKQWPVFNYGDDSVTAGEYLKLQVMAYSKSENWIYGESFVTHTYMTPNNKGKPWVASFTGCCKLSEINNQPQMDAPWLLETSIDLIALTASPRLTAMPVISLPDPPILPTPAPQDPTIPKVPVSFYVPGFHPDGHDATVTTLASPLTALSGTITDIDPECDADGKVTLNFHGITEAETADKGMFYFLKLNATSVATGLFVQADFLIRVHKNPEHLMPTIAFGHTDLQNLPGPPTLTSPLNVSAWANGYVPSTPAARFWPDAAYQAYVGFPVNFTVVAQDPNVEQRVGFSAFGLPEYARVTTVQGTNPVQITTFWTPCEGQHGRHVMCYDAVDSFGNTSTAECVNVMVAEDPAPIFGPATDRDGKYQQKTVDMDQVVHVTMGATKHYTLLAYDQNCLDEVTIRVQGQLPPGAVMSAQTKGSSPVQCTRASATQAVVRTMEWLAPPNYGGNVTEICFSASDIGGGCHAAGRVDVTVKCVTFKVLKCKYSVGGEHQIAEVARLFGTDWLQIWKQNPGIVHPDYILFSGQALDVGRLYTVAASDSLYAISKRFGTPLETLYQLNYDLHGQPMVAEGFDLCLIPNSCRGEEASVYEGVSELRVYQCHEGNDGSGVGSNDGTVFPSLEACRAACSLTGGTCSSLSTVVG